MNATTKANEMKKNASTTKKEMSNRDKEKNIRTEILKPNIFDLSSKSLSRYRINTLLCDLKFTPTPKCNNIEVKSNKQITRADCDLH